MATNLAGAVLILHLGIIVFNVAGLFVVPVGAWRLVRMAWLRLLHLGLLAIVAGQALEGRACILTIWQNRLAGNTAAAPPLVLRWVDHMVYWNVPFWVFTVLYTVLFLYVLALIFLVPFGAGPYVRMNDDRY